MAGKPLQAFRVAALCLALGWGATGCGGGASAPSPDGDAKPAEEPAAPVISVEDLERLNREFLEMQRLRERLEAQLEIALRETALLRERAAELEAREILVHSLINRLRGQGPPPSAGSDPYHLAIAYGPFAIAGMALYILWKMRRSRLREELRRRRRTRRKQEAAAAAVESVERE